MCVFVHLLLDIWIVSTLGLKKKADQENSLTNLYVDVCLHFSWVKTDVELLFMCLFAICVSLFGEVSDQIFSLF